MKNIFPAFVFASVVLPVASGMAATPGLNAYMTTGVQSTVEALIPEFEKTTGQPIVATWGTSASLEQRLRAGEAVDLLIGTRSSIEALIKDGKITGPAVDIASSSVAIAIRKGEPRPDISTPESLRNALLATRGISYPDPAGGGVAGIHFAKVLDRLGIAAEMRAKTRFPGPGAVVADLLARGEVDLAVQLPPELLSVKGTEILGALPADLQFAITLTAGIPSASRQVETATAFLRFLQSPQARALMKEKGLSP